MLTAVILLAASCVNSKPVTKVTEAVGTLVTNCVCAVALGIKILLSLILEIFQIEAVAGP